MATMASDTGSDDLTDAALSCISRWGVAKTTLEDVARQAGCSRATVYRTFPGGKEALLASVAAVEIARLVDIVGRAIDAADDLEDAVVAAITTTAHALSTHAAFQYVLANEPGVVLPHLAFTQLDALLAVVADRIGPAFARFLGPFEEAERLAEWAARIVISHTCSPSTGVHLADDASVRRLVRTFVLPGLLVAT